MTTFLWIILASVSMSLLALSGILLLYLSDPLQEEIIPYLIALSAGTLTGGSFLHLIPESIHVIGNTQTLFLIVIAGFSLFLLMEQGLMWHHSHRPGRQKKQPVTYLILIADSLHNFIGGFAIASSFLVNVHVGWITWIAAASHEIPQEFGDFGILVKGGWKKNRALLFNFLSALTIVPGALLVYFFSGQINVMYLLPFAAGNFIYIAASDLIPEIKHSESIKGGLGKFILFLVGVGIIVLARSLHH